MSEMLNKLKDIVESNGGCHEEIIRVTCYWAKKILVHNQDVFRWSPEVITHREFVEYFSTLIDFDEIGGDSVKLTHKSFGPEILSAMDELMLFKKKRYKLPRDVETYLDIIKFFSNKIEARECTPEINKFNYGNLENKHLVHVMCNRDSYSIIQNRENGPYIIPNQLIEKMKRKLFNHLKKKALDDPENLIEFLRIKGFDAPGWVVENLINKQGNRSTYIFESESQVDLHGGENVELARSVYPNTTFERVDDIIGANPHLTTLMTSLTSREGNDPLYRLTSHSATRNNTWYVTKRNRIYSVLMPRHAARDALALLTGAETTPTPSLVKSGGHYFVKQDDRILAFNTVRREELNHTLDTYVQYLRNRDIKFTPVGEENHTAESLTAGRIEFQSRNNTNNTGRVFVFHHASAEILHDVKFLGSVFELDQCALLMHACGYVYIDDVNTMASITDVLANEILSGDTSNGNGSDNEAIPDPGSERGAVRMRNIQNRIRNTVATLDSAHNCKEYIYMKSLTIIFNYMMDQGIVINRQHAGIVFRAVNTHQPAFTTSLTPIVSQLSDANFTKLRVAISSKKLLPTIFRTMNSLFSSPTTAHNENDLVAMASQEDMRFLQYTTEDVRDVIRQVVDYVRILIRMENRTGLITEPTNSDRSTFETYWSSTPITEPTNNDSIEESIYAPIPAIVRIFSERHGGNNSMEFTYINSIAHVLASLFGQVHEPTKQIISEVISRVTRRVELFGLEMTLLSSGRYDLLKSVIERGLARRAIYYIFNRLSNQNYVSSDIGYAIQLIRHDERRELSELAISSDYEMGTLLEIAVNYYNELKNQNDNMSDDASSESSRGGGATGPIGTARSTSREPEIPNPFSKLTDNNLKSNVKSLAKEMKEMDNKMTLIKATAIRIKEIGGINKMMDDYDIEIATITKKYLQKITG